MKTKGEIIANGIAIPPTDSRLINELRASLINGIIKRWYPLVLDEECGGYYTNISHDWKIMPEQEKMIVTQARHIWTLSKAAEFLNDKKNYERMARYGFSYLKNKMWDEKYGGFYQIRSRDGEATELEGWLNEKRVYGNAFAVFALAALYKLTDDLQVLNFAQRAFVWIENNAYDLKYKGYFQFLTAESEPFDNNSDYKTIASDKNEVGLKDQNSSIHLLEAFTELYKVWQDPLVAERLQSLLEIIRDVIVTPQGYMQLFFNRNWTPVSFHDCSIEERKANFKLDHISFGHDYETAFLMLEASYALGLEDDVKTLATARKMLDHAIQYGWDEKAGGFFDGGYYLKGSDRCSIIRDTKSWWAQAEGLNALLLFANIFPEEKKYYKYFLRQWDYIKKFVIDSVNGDWFERGIDKEPQFKTKPKSHMWKCTYHTCRALMNCIAMLEGEENSKINRVISHWRETAKLL